MCLDGETLYVADTENHAIRAVDLKTTPGHHGRRHGPPDRRGCTRSRSPDPAKTTALCAAPGTSSRSPATRRSTSPWPGRTRSGSSTCRSETVGVFAGSGYENILDGGAESARFAQPSGLATDGEHLFVADSEVSGIRMITGSTPASRSCGRSSARACSTSATTTAPAPSSASSTAWAWPTATATSTSRTRYNNKIKVCNPKTHAVQTLVGSHKPGDSDNPPHFYQPGGLSVAGSELYVADTNNHKIRVVDLKTRTVKTLALAGLTAPRQAPRPPSFPKATSDRCPGGRGAAGRLGRASRSRSPCRRASSSTKRRHAWSTSSRRRARRACCPIRCRPEGERIKPQVHQFTIDVPLAQRRRRRATTIELRLSVLAFVCSESSSVCHIRSTIWNVPVRFSASKKPGEAIPLSDALRRQAMT